MYDAQALKNAVSMVLPAAGAGMLDEGYKDIVFNGKYIIATNDRICIAHPFETDFKVSIPAKEFKDLIPNSGEVDLKATESNLIIKFGKTKSTLAVSSGSITKELFESLNISDVRWKKLNKDLMKGLDLCRFSASREMTEPYLMCIHINKDTITASDEVRISQYKTPKKLTMKPWLIPAISVNELLKIEVHGFAVTDAWFYFKDKDNRIFCARRVVDQYPDVSEYFKFKEVDRIKLPVDAIKESARYVSTMANVGEDGFKRITIAVDGKDITIEGKNDLGTATKVVTAKTKAKKKFKIVMNPEFLTELVGLSDTIKVGKDRVLVETDNFRHLVALFVEE